MEMSSMRLTQMIEKHQLATQVDLLHPTLWINPNESPSPGLGPGGCVPLKQLDNRPDLLHVALKEPGMTHLDLKIFLVNPKEQTIKDIV